MSPVTRAAGKCLFAEPVTCGPRVVVPHGGDGRDEPQRPGHADGIGVFVAGIALQVLDRLHRDLFRAVRLSLGEQDVTEIPLRGRHPYRIVGRLSRQHAPVGDEQRQVSPPDPLGERPQQEEQVSADPLRFPPVVGRRAARQTPLCRVHVGNQVRQDFRNLGVTVRRSLPDRPRLIDPVRAG